MGFDFQRVKRLFGSSKALGDMAIGMTQPTDWWPQLTYDLFDMITNFGGIQPQLRDNQWPLSDVMNNLGEILPHH
jgi:hypothetical protein